MKAALVLVLALPALAACAGGGASTSLPSSPTVAGSSNALSEMQSDAQWAASEPAQTGPANNFLYIGNTGNNSITVYPHAASGNTPPRYIIAGSNTGITNPGQLSEDSQGNLYVANSNSILVFAHGANGNVAPIRRLAGALTGIHFVRALTVDQTSGKLFVTDDAPPSAGFERLLRFPRNASGDQAPFAQSAATLFYPLQLASDSTGKNIIFAHGPVCCNAASVGVDTVAKQFPNGAQLNDLYEITTFATGGIADDPTTKTYLTTSGAIYRFAEDTDGNGPDADYGPITPHYSPAPVSVITSDTCGTQLAVAPGPAPNTFVVHSTQSGCPADAVYVYSHNASGSAAPLRVLSGLLTKLDQPYGIYEGY